jgi:hypothetical protein
MQGLAGSGTLYQIRAPPLHAGDPAAASAAVHRIPYDRVSHVLQVHPDLVSAARMQLEAEQVNHVETGHHEGVGAGGPPSGSDGHPLPVV